MTPREVIRVPIMVKNTTAILFVHIPKCGGSSFEKEMQNRGWKELLSIRNTHANQLKFMRCSPQHMHAELLKKIVRPDHFDNIITLIRDPFERLKSEYAWQVSQGLTDFSAMKWIDFTLSEFSVDPFIYDNHIRPQHEFLLEDALVFKLEENGISRALKIILPAENRSNLAQKLFCRNSDPGKLKVTRKSPATTEAFEQRKSQILDFYGRDYETLNYPVPKNR